MRTILETLTIAAEHFEKAGVDSPRLTAEILLAESLRCRRIDLYLRFDQPLTGWERETFGAMYKRRLAREPLQYITGTAQFCGLEFEVNPAVLIPRPETEELAMQTARLCEERFVNPPPRILDVGAGSGCIALTLAKRFPSAAVTGIDISPEAVAVARRNAERNGVANADFFVADIFDDDALDGEFDVIVSNPPYISREEFETLQQEVRNFEPRIATTDNADGLTFFRRISALAPKHLSPRGMIAFETGYEQASQVRVILSTNGFAAAVIKDMAGMERIVAGAFRPWAE